MFAQTNVANTPTLSVTYGGVRGEDYYYQESDVWKHPILSKHVPPAVLQARAVRRRCRLAAMVNAKASPLIGKCGASHAAA